MTFTGCSSILTLRAKALNMDMAAVDETTALGVTPEWDSLGHVNLIVALEERLGRHLEPEAIVGISGMQDIVLLLEAEGCEEGEGIPLCGALPLGQ
mgnify:CR=1 FL=1